MADGSCPLPAQACQPGCAKSPSPVTPPQPAPERLGRIPPRELELPWVYRQAGAKRVAHGDRTAVPGAGAPTGNGGCDPWPGLHTGALDGWCLCGWPGCGTEADGSSRVGALGLSWTSSANVTAAKASGQAQARATAVARLENKVCWPPAVVAPLHP